jgi:hypothetical protein
VRIAVADSLRWSCIRHTTTPARLQAVITTAALSEADKSAWCRAQRIYPAQLEQWCASATTALAEPQDARASPQAKRHDCKRTKELESELLRKDRALAEIAALLVLSKKSRRSARWARTHDPHRRSP